MSAGTPPEQTMDAPPVPHWTREVRRRAVTFPLLKTCGISVFMAAFFAGYLYLLNHPLFPVYPMPLTWLDHQLAFLPSLLPVYLSLWAYVFLPTLLLDRRADLLSYAAASCIVCLIGILCFLLLPTAVPANDPRWGAHAGIPLLSAVDASGNACPSLHVAMAVLSSIWLGGLLRELAGPWWLGWLNVLWCAAIVYSTLAIRQHVVLDVVAGIFLGALVGALAMRRRVCREEAS